MFYYENEDRVWEFQEEVTEDNKLTRLTIEQESFYLLNPGASWDEIKICKLIDPTNLIFNISSEINRILLSTDVIVNRHRDQVELNYRKTITDLEYTELLRYRQYLRDLSKDPNYLNLDASYLIINKPQFLNI